MKKNEKYIVDISEIDFDEVQRVCDKITKEREEKEHIKELERKEKYRKQNDTGIIQAVFPLVGKSG